MEINHGLKRKKLLTNTIKFFIIVRILINPKTCSSSGINSTTNNVNIINHGFKTFDKIYYSSNDVIEGLNNGQTYFAFKVDDDNFKLAESFNDLFQSIRILEFSSIGNNHEFSLVNPRIDVVRNNQK